MKVVKKIILYKFNFYKICLYALSIYERFNSEKVLYSHLEVGTEYSDSANQ